MIWLRAKSAKHFKYNNAALMFICVFVYILGGFYYSFDGDGRENHYYFLKWRVFFGSIICGKKFNENNF